MPGLRGMRKMISGKHVFRNWILCCGILIILMLSVCAAAVIYVDPFFHYHAPLRDFPYVVDNQLSQNPGMALHMKYDSVITGSSMTANFDTDWFKEDMGLNTLKLTCNGAYPKDISNTLVKVYESGNTVKAAFISLDIDSFSASTDEIKYPLPGYLYDRDPFNDVQYLFNSDVITEYIIRPFIMKEPTDMTDVYASWWTPDYYSRDFVMQGYSQPEKAQTPKSAECYSEASLLNLKTNMTPYIDAHPETEFYLFYPAYSVLFWNDMRAGNEIDARMRQYKVITDELLKHKNVRIFFFADNEKVITDLDNYADEIHARPEWSRQMAGCFADGTDEVRTGAQLDTHVSHLRSIISGFDYDGLFAEYSAGN